MNHMYPGRWLEIGGPVERPARSPDSTPLDYYFWGHVKSIVYVTPLDDTEQLLARILAASDVVR
jgi:hypothetical protein